MALMGLVFVDVQRDPVEAARRILVAYDASEASIAKMSIRLAVHRATIMRWIGWIERNSAAKLRIRMGEVRKKYSVAIHRRHVEGGRLGGRPPVVRVAA